MRRGPLLAVVVAADLVLAGAAVGATRTTEAAWADAEHAAAAVAAGTVTPVTAMSCSLGIGTVRFTWTAPTGGLTRSGYRWTVVGTVTGVTLGSGSSTDPATTTVQMSAVLFTVASTFSLYAEGPGGWESVAKTGTVALLGASCLVL